MFEHRDLISLIFLSYSLFHIKAEAEIIEAIVGENTGIPSSKPSGFENEPLILTPLIAKGKLEEARTKSRVYLKDGGTGEPETESYSGYFTVDPKHHSHLFFWFFPAQRNPVEAPLLLWLQGGPGTSSLMGLFNEIGPYYITENGNLKLRPTSWGLGHSLLFFDNPVGTGFSFTEDKAGFSRTPDEAANNLYTALLQFFRLFPMYKSNEFYLTGESYGAKFILSLATRIHQENQKVKSNDMKMNLKGFAFGNGYFDPASTISSYGTFLYNAGLLDENEKKHFDKEEKKALRYIRRRRYRKAYDVQDTLFSGAITPYPTYYTNVTGYSYHFSIFYDKEPAHLTYFNSYLNKAEVQTAIHAGRKNYTLRNSTVLEYFLDEKTRSRNELLVKLLEAPENYRVLIYSGNLDMDVPTISTEKTLSHLKWKWTKCYRKAPKAFWKVKGDLAGYIKEYKNLSFLVVRNAGHMVPADQPITSLDMINRYTSGQRFADVMPNSDNTERTFSFSRRC